jgi:hypothetical protein
MLFYFESYSGGHRLRDDHRLMAAIPHGIDTDEATVLVDDGDQCRQAEA